MTGVGPQSPLTPQSGLSPKMETLLQPGTGQQPKQESPCQAG